MSDLNSAPKDYTALVDHGADIFEVHVQDWVVALTFGMRATRESESHQYTDRVRLSLPAAKALAMLLLRQLRTYEQRVGMEIALPAQLVQVLGIPAEDWERPWGDDPQRPWVRGG